MISGMLSASPAQIHKGLGIFGPVVSSTPRLDANGGALVGLRWKWLGPAVQIRVSPSTGVSPGLAQCLSPDQLIGDEFCAPVGTLCCSTLIMAAKRARNHPRYYPPVCSFPDIPIIIIHSTMNLNRV